MNTNFYNNISYRESLALTYLEVKEFVINQGYSNEIDWQYATKPQNLNASIFLREAAWVILNSGMREKIITKLFPKISKAFYEWDSLDLICNNSEQCKLNALKYFNHRGKIDAIIYIAKYLNTWGFDFIFKQLDEKGADFLTLFPYIGPATSLHLAKNLGFSCIKPDRHLKRIASKLGYEDPRTMCELISSEIDEQISVVDIVLWRYATIQENYLDKFSKFTSRDFIT